MDTLVLPQLAITKVYPFVRSTGAPLYQPECTVAIPSTTSCLVGLRQSLAKAGQTTNRGATARAKTPHQGRENESDGTNHHPDAITGCWSAIELDLGDGVFRMEKIQEPARVGRLRGSDADTVRQWFQSAGARD